jgi:phosphopantothenoylcysteine decarboxylase/phosphopantothenate--cysteine ligase
MIVTAGPAAEFLDQVRCITNHSTGRLGSFLADFLAAHGHEVRCYLGTHSRHTPQRPDVQILPFTGNSDLGDLLENGNPAWRPDVIFHAAALADFKLAHAEGTTSDGATLPMNAGKIPSKLSRLVITLEPAPKILPKLRVFFPNACIVGWKYEVDGDRATCTARGWEQINSCQTHFCVVNGPSYGDGFGLLCAEKRSCEHAASLPQLAELLLTETTRHCGAAL